MNKTKIDWCDSTWNPVTGCLHGCEYCYARSIANRFGGCKGDEKIHVLNSAIFVQHRNEEGGWNKEYKCAYPYSFDPTFHRYRLNEYQNKRGRNIFVCSMADLFGKWVPDSWIEEIFAACEKAPQHNYLFLTKNPDRYIALDLSGKLLHGENVWYGLTVSDKKQAEGAMIAADMTEKTGAFLSIEPLLEDVLIDDLKTVIANFIDWVIIGAETGNRKGKVIPERKWIEDIVGECRKYNKPVFMKSSLADIWGEPLIQERPKELIH